MMKRRKFVGLASGLLAMFTRPNAALASVTMAMGRGPRAGSGPPEEKTSGIGPIPPLQGNPGTFELCEFRIPLRGEGLKGLNPFRATELALDGEFRSPSGKVLRVPGFYDQEFVLQDHKGIPVAGTAGWRVRFSGGEPGPYTSKFELRVKGDLVDVQEGPSFRLTKSSGHGMIRVGRSSPRYLEYVDGSSYFAIGQDVCWTTDVTKTIPGVRISCPVLPWDEAYARWFGRMGQSGANWARVFMKPNFYLESGEPWAWPLESAWRLDKILELARQNGIYICLCFNPERSDSGACYKGSMDLMRASNTAWGRLLATRQHGFEQFFTDPLAREMYRDKIRYIIARWGYSPNIFSWELWNEIETVTSREGVGRWCREMTSYLRAVDPWHHLIKSSAHHAWSPQYWGEDNGDLNDVHPYFGWAGDEGPQNLGAFLPEFSSGVCATGRPFIIGETGIAREVTTKYGLAGDLADQDTTGFHVHEALWGGLFSGAVGTGMVWWWDEHVDLHDAYPRFRAVANFVADIEFNRESFTRGEKAFASTDQLRLFELIGRTTRLLWIRHRNLSWYGVAVGKIPLEPVSQASVTLTGLESDKYRVEVWSPEEGKLLRTEEFAVQARSMVIALPEFRTELALKVRRTS